MARTGFIGAGNMATSIIGGLLQAGHVASDIRASDPAPSERAQKSGIDIVNDNSQICRWADVLVLAVKPQTMEGVCKQIAPTMQKHRALIISIAAGITSNSICHWLGASVPCIRVMPNTPALHGLGMSGFFANEQCSANDIETALSLMQTVGKVIQVRDEPTIDLVTAISGSGPAYFFLLIEAMIKSGMTQGLSEQEARTLATQTAIGAAAMADQSDTSVQDLRRRVTSPGGTTERAIATMIDGGFFELIDDAVRAAALRSVELSTQLGVNPDE
jgi:pyrroline-5-carboxylate reductase